MHGIFSKTAGTCITHMGNREEIVDNPIKLKTTLYRDSCYFQNLSV